MQLKAYDFRYSNKIEKLINGFFSICTNFAAPIFTFFIVSIAMALSGIIKYITMEMFLVLFGASVLLGFVSCIKYFCCFKGIILYGSCLEIATHTLGLAKSKPKIKINYSDIASIYNSTYNLRYDRKKARRTFLVGDYSDYVEITLRGGKQFCFSVENQQEFVDEVILRIDKAKEDNEKNK